ncbi:B12-binding domain-containing radical SAM protein [Thermodesulfobacteriota bacterium]
MRIDFVHIGREHLGIEYLSAILKEAGHQVRLHYDPGIFGSEDNAFQIARLARRFDQSRRIVTEIVSDPPDVLAFPVYTSTFQWALAIARDVREKVRVPTVFGGPHATVAPEVVAADPAVDVAVVGEADAVIVELAERLASGRDFHNLSNIAFLQDGGVTLRALADPCDLDQLPFPDKRIFEKEVNIVDDYLIMTNRGCPFGCTYCCENAINHLYGKQYLRRRSVASVIEDLCQGKKRYGFREVMFNDAIFFTDKDWLLDLLDQYRLRIGVPFRCFGQILYLDGEIARALKAADCYAVEFGLQTTSDTIRRDLLGRRETLADAARAFDICDKEGLRYDIDHMFNLPGETVQQGRDALRFYMGRRMLNRIKVHYLTYFPGTAMMEYAIEHGILDKQAANRIHEGITGDFFHAFTANDPAMIQHIKGFTRLMRLLPLLSERMVNWLTRTDRHLWFARVPGLLIILFQILVALRGRDYRYILYIRYYIHRIRRLRTLARRAGEEEEAA